MVKYEDIQLENKNEICNYIKRLLYIDRLDTDIIVPHVSIKYNIPEEEVSKCLLYVKYCILNKE